MDTWRRIPLVVPLLCLPGATAFAVEVTVDLEEVTNMAAAVSPDGSELIVDAQGVLWRLPIEGGEAEQVTDFTLEPARPDWSPNGDAIVFQSYTGGTFDVWTMSPDGSNLQQLTEGPYDEREPTWSPDGSQIAFVSDRGGSYDVWSLDVASGELRQWTSSETQEAYPAWSPDGSEIAYVVDDAAIEAIGQDGATRTLAESPDDELLSPSWSPSGEDVAYVRLADGETFLMLNEQEIAADEDVFPFRPEWLDGSTVLYTADGKIRVRDLDGGSADDIPFSAELVLDRPEFDRKDFDFDSRRAKRVTGIVTPALSPDGQQIAFAAPERSLADGDGEEAAPAHRGCLLGVGSCVVERRHAAGLRLGQGGHPRHLHPGPRHGQRIAADLDRWGRAVPGLVARRQPDRLPRPERGDLHRRRRLRQCAAGRGQPLRAGPAELVGGRQQAGLRRGRALFRALPRGDQPDPGGRRRERRADVRRAGAEQVDRAPRRQRPGLVAGRQRHGLHHGWLALGGAGRRERADHR